MEASVLEDFDEILLTDYFVDLLVFLANLTNIAVVCSILGKQSKVLNSGYLLLLQLTVTDVVHDLHAKIFKVTNIIGPWRYEPENVSTWLQHNLFLGFTIQLVSFLAILYIIFKECWSSQSSKTKSLFLEEFYTSYGVLWTLALLLSLNIILSGTNCDYLISTPQNQDILPRDYFNVQAYGIQCQIRDAQTWQIIYQVLTHPLWFPLLCLIFTPFLAFVLIKRESRKDHEENHRILVILVITYFSMFFYDLINYGSQDNHDLNYTHAKSIQLYNQDKVQESALELTLVFNHWGRPFVAFVRNILCLSVIYKQGTNKMY